MFAVVGGIKGGAGKTIMATNLAVLRAASDPPNAPPLLHGKTAGATPFRINLHFGDLGSVS